MQSRVELILASTSSRRRKLLDQLGILYTSQVPIVDELPVAQEKPARYVRRFARAKAEDVWASSMQCLPVLAADTIIALDEVILGKPQDRQMAEHYLNMLSGREHLVLTALCLRTQQGVNESVVKIMVKFRDITPSELEAYCSTQEPYDKAGAYAIQGLAAAFVEYITGSYTGVVGLPLPELRLLLQQSSLTD